ncbi:LacI family DNA-binding transcriptional regulator [Bordetella sp. 2513F-2]
MKASEPSPDDVAIPRKRVTVHDVARAAGVAISTVSRVVNGAPTVTDDIRQRVESAIRQLGWTPSIAAQAMRGASARMVGFIFSDIRNPMYTEVIKGAEDVLSAHGYMLMVASSDGQPARELALIELFRRRRADGLLFGVEEESNPEVMRGVVSAGFPTVLLEREMALPINAVGADHCSGTLHATRHLIALGHRRIALISGGRRNRVGRDRLAGLSQAHEAAGLPLDPALLRLDSFATEYAFRETQLLLALDEPPTAIIAAGMHLLEGVLPAVRAAGLAIPGDLSLVASNDSPLARLATPAISVIRYDAYALGREAAMLLLGRMQEGEPATRSRIQIPTEFVLRDSCASPPRRRDKRRR